LTAEVSSFPWLRWRGIDVKDSCRGCCDLSRRITFGLRLVSLQLSATSVRSRVACAIVKLAPFGRGYPQYKTFSNGDWPAGLVDPAGYHGCQHGNEQQTLINTQNTR
jgi:hypothetical protein